MENKILNEQIKENFIKFLIPLRESLEDIFRNNNFCGKEWATIKLKIEDLQNENRKIKRDKGIRRNLKKKQEN